MRFCNENIKLSFLFNKGCMYFFGFVIYMGFLVLWFFEKIVFRVVQVKKKDYLGLV